MFEILTAKFNDTIINCYDGNYKREELKKYDKDNMLFCPICNELYIYCHGDSNTPYFRHKIKEECIYKYHEPETEEHLKGKIALFEWIKTMKDVTNPIMECWMPISNQRPDIAFRYRGEPFVIEYQCTPISTEYHERHNLYRSLGVTDIWICGTDKYLEKEEIGNRFRIKEIERNTKYYYDSKYDIFIVVKNEEDKDEEDTFILNFITSYQNRYRNSKHIDYFQIAGRENIQSQNLLHQQYSSQHEARMLFAKLQNIAFYEKPHIEYNIDLNFKYVSE